MAIKKKLTAAQISAIRKKPPSQRTMAEVRMIMPNAKNVYGHTQAEIDKYAADAKKVKKFNDKKFNEQKKKKTQAGANRLSAKTKTVSNRKKALYKRSAVKRKQPGKGN